MRSLLDSTIGQSAAICTNPLHDRLTPSETKGPKIQRSRSEAGALTSRKIPTGKNFAFRLGALVSASLAG